MSNHQQEFIIARGIPASGKSTWAQKWVAEDPFNRVRVNRDDLRFALSKELYGKGQWIVLDKKGFPDRDFENRVTNLEHKLIQNALKTGKSVVSDNTNLTSKFSQPFIKMAKQYNVPVKTKEFPVTREEAIRRDAARDRSVGPKVIGRMFNNLGPNGEFHHIDGTFEVQPFKAPKKPGQAAIFIDLDGTLNDIRNARKWLDKDARGKRNFDMFHRSSLFCPVNEDVVNIIKEAQENGIAVLITTARSEPYREVSQRWLAENGITFDNYYCRKANDFRPDYEVKKEIYDEIDKSYLPLLAVDDNPQALASWREKGLPTVEVKFYGGDITPEEMTEKVTVKNPFKPGTCIRCGQPISKGIIGPKCATR